MPVEKISTEAERTIKYRVNYKKMNETEWCGQGSEVERPWVHIFLQAHENYNYLQSSYWWEWPEN